MTPDDSAPSAPFGSSLPSGYEEPIAELLARLPAEGSQAIAEFERQHPRIASWLGQHLHLLAAPEPDLPPRIRPCEILSRLGAGSFGDVFLARQTEPFERLVALKQLKYGGKSEVRMALFRREIQALALLNHDGIAKVYDAGTTEDGQLYFSMEYVGGASPLTDFCHETRLGLESRLRLFVQVCRAVEHAHRQGILHRDLKPTNILVNGAETDGEPVAKIIDFGLAKAIAADSGPSFAGTVEYMSPEQVDGSGQAVVGTHSDVYSLGVVLYQLLTGLLPLGPCNREKLAEYVRAIREQEPSSPSQRVIATSPRHWSRLLAGDLDAIVGKALAKNADDRYGSAAELAEDVLLHLRHEPVKARERTTRYVLGKFVRRHRMAVWFAATAFVLVAIGITGFALDQLEKQKLFQRGNLFGVMKYLDTLRERDLREPPPAHPDYIPHLESWLERFETVSARRDEMIARLDEPEPDGSDPADPAEWASGANAEKTLREELDRTLRLLARMDAPDGEIARVRRRLAWARQVRARTVDAHLADWARVKDQVKRDDVYAGMTTIIEPQVGLIPVGRREDGYQEFVLPLPGGEMPDRRGDSWDMRGRSWPVFVLLPGCEFDGGSQSDDESAPFYDQHREDDEATHYLATIEPLFASRFELTRGQWELTRRGDARTPGEGAESLPIMNVDWRPMVHALYAWGMALPTPEEWEYMARGGTTNPYWSGPHGSSLEGKENLFDQALDDDPFWLGEGDPVAWSDGFVGAAPVGSFDPNPFLLHDILGNACEVALTFEDRGGWPAPVLQLRGSSWHEGLRDARATAQTTWDGSKKASIGVRPVIYPQ